MRFQRYSGYIEHHDIPTIEIAPEGCAHTLRIGYVELHDQSTNAANLRRIWEVLDAHFANEGNTRTEFEQNNWLAQNASKL